MERITSFTVDHDFIKKDIYISRIDGDIVTYDLRTRIPNAGDIWIISPCIPLSICSQPTFAIPI